MADRYDVIVIGAGPAGMMSAIRAAQRNKRVLLLERNALPGAKLLITGGGRCNLTNQCDRSDCIAKFSPSRDFLRNAFAQFFNSDLVSFFEKAGVACAVEKQGCVFPASGKASDIVGVLREKLKDNAVVLLTGERARAIIAKNRKVEGVVTCSDKRFSAPRVVVSTGGASYPQTGSTGDGYSLAKELGHAIVPIRPALVPLIIKERSARSWQGISLKNARVTLLCNGKRAAQRAGGLLFTHFGVSGPMILDMSAAAYDALALKNSVELSINVIPGIHGEAAEAFVLDELKVHPGKSVKNMFNDVLPRGMMEGFLGYCGLSPLSRANQVTIRQRRRLAAGLSGLRLTVEATLPLKDGMVTRGGVSTKEIHPKTMESRLIPGLFFAGEVIDIDANTGGYNSQAAFSTGWVCGENV